MTSPWKRDDLNLDPIEEKAISLAHAREEMLLKFLKNGCHSVVYDNNDNPFDEYEDGARYLEAEYSDDETVIFYTFFMEDDRILTKHVDHAFEFKEKHSDEIKGFVGRLFLGALSVYPLEDFPENRSWNEKEYITNLYGEYGFLNNGIRNIEILAEVYDMDAVIDEVEQRMENRQNEKLT